MHTHPLTLLALMPGPKLEASQDSADQAHVPAQSSEPMRPIEFLLQQLLQNPRAHGGEVLRLLRLFFPKQNLVGFAPDWCTKWGPFCLFFRSTHSLTHSNLVTETLYVWLGHRNRYPRL